MSNKAQLSTAALALASAVLLSACGNSVEEQATVATSPSATASSSASQATASATPSKSSATPSPTQTTATPAETSPAPSPAVEEVEAAEASPVAPSPASTPVEEHKTEETAPDAAASAAPEKSGSSAPVPVGTVITVPANETPKAEASLSPTSSPQVTTPAPVASAGSAQANTATPQVCNYGNLQVAAAAADGSGAAGSRYITLSFTNTGDTPCSISGYPGVNYVDANGNQIGVAASQAAEWTSSGRILTTGETITATLRETRAGLYDAQTCQPQTAAGYRVTLPGTSNSLIITFPAEACSGAVSQLSVGQVGAGS